jgi:hypothetical protein
MANVKIKQKTLVANKIFPPTNKDKTFGHFKGL